MIISITIYSYIYSGYSFFILPIVYFRPLELEFFLKLLYKKNPDTIKKNSTQRNPVLINLAFIIG